MTVHLNKAILSIVSLCDGVVLLCGFMWIVLALSSAARQGGKTSHHGIAVGLALRRNVSSHAYMNRCDDTGSIMYDGAYAMSL